MSTDFSIDTRIAELLQWQADTGQELPLPVSAILTAEDNGLVVDLDTGEIHGGNWATEWLADLLAGDGDGDR